MPSPFSSKQTPQTKVDEEVVPITNSTLVCEFCFHENSDGTYYPKVQTLTWTCIRCEKRNIVRNIEL